MTMTLDIFMSVVADQCADPFCGCPEDKECMTHEDLFECAEMPQTTDDSWCYITDFGDLFTVDYVNVQFEVRLNGLLVNAKETAFHTIEFILINQ